MLLKKFESIERTLINVNKNFRIKNVVLLGNTSKENTKMSCIYNKSYNSKKYTNFSKLDKIVIDERDFLVLSYFAKTSDTDILSEEFYFSYNNLYKLYLTFEAITSVIINPENKIFKNKEGSILVSKKFKDVSSDIEVTSGGKKKKLIFKFDVGEDENGELFPAVLVIMGKEECYSFINIDTFINITKFLEKFNLETNSAVLLNTAIMYEHLTTNEKSSSMEGNNFGRNNTGRARVRRVEEDISEEDVDSVFDDASGDDEEEEEIKLPKKSKKSKKDKKNKKKFVIPDDDDSSDDDDDMIPF